MPRPRQTRSAAFKAEVALAALRETLPVRELAARYGVTTSQIAAWKRQRLARVDQIFGSTDEASARSRKQPSVAALRTQISRPQQDLEWLRSKTDDSR